MRSLSSAWSSPKEWHRKMTLATAYETATLKAFYLISYEQELHYDDLSGLIRDWNSKKDTPLFTFSESRWLEFHCP